MFPWNLFPFNKDMKNRLQNMKPEEVNHFINDIMGKIMPSHLDGMMNSQDLFKNYQPQSSQQTNSLNPLVFETHDLVFVRIPILDENWLSQMKIFHTTNQLIVEHVPEQDDKHSITLPAMVRKKGASAKYKDGILEIKLYRRTDMQFSEIEFTEN